MVPVVASTSAYSPVLRRCRKVVLPVPLRPRSRQRGGMGGWMGLLELIRGRMSRKRRTQLLQQKDMAKLRARPAREE